MAKKRITQSKKILGTSVPETVFKEGEIESISELLFEQLKLHGGNGLSANQLGKNVRISVVNVIDPITLVNPVIIDQSDDKLLVHEQCLSIKKSFKKAIKTERWRSVTVKTDNLGTLVFGPDNEPNTSQDKMDLGLLESITVQHEIDHLNGITITDTGRRFVETIVVEKKIGRNDFVTIEHPDGKTEEVKYKKAKFLVHYGCKILK